MIHRQWTFDKVNRLKVLLAENHPFAVKYHKETKRALEALIALYNMGKYEQAPGCLPYRRWKELVDRELTALNKERV